VEKAGGGDQSLYLFGVIPEAQGLPSDAGVSLRAVPHSTVVALVEAVCASEFSPDVLDEKLKCIDWVARLARRHETVLERAMRHGPVVPARLCTLFTSAEALGLSLADNEERLVATLERVRGRQEWGLKVSCDESRLRSIAGPDDREARALQTALETASPGQAFVLRKKRDARMAEVAEARVDAVLDEVVDAIELVTVDVRLLPLLSEAATGRSEPMVLNIAALVGVAGHHDFDTTLTQLSNRFRAEGFTFETTGPWPPYSFCDDGDDD
jgi:hypothetical protein